MERLLAFAQRIKVDTSEPAVEPHRSFYDLPSSNGWGAVVVDFQQARAHHWRDHLFATEEPRIDAGGAEVWSNNLPEDIKARDLLFDTYFGLRSDGNQRWLTALPVDLDASGWEEGSSVIRMVQSLGDLQATTYVWAPWSLERSAMAMVLKVENTGNATVSGLTAFHLQNVHVGEGRPGPTQDIGAQNETVLVGNPVRIERGFAGQVASVSLTTPSVETWWHPSATWGNPFDVVNDGGVTDLPTVTAAAGPNDDTTAYTQWDHGDLAAGETTWFGLVMAHDGNPFDADLETELLSWASGHTPESALQMELDTWSTFQAGITLPPNLSLAEHTLYRQSAVVLRMAQVRETEAYLREWLTTDGEPRYSQFTSTLPADVPHLAAGGVLASLPPGNWTYAWPRDGAYAIVGMAYAGMHEEAAEALRYMLEADTDRYRNYDELAGVPVGPYAISLCRHHGFGVEESDTLGGGDFNFEFDGAGLFLFALDHYLRASGDTTFVDTHWETIRDEVAGFLVPLIDPVTNLIVRDSSIWEHHWLGKERYWAYTSITASRGLCTAADLAEARGETALATTWREAANTIRDAILSELQAPDRSVAQTLEELQFGAGYVDGATIEAVGMGLLDPEGAVGQATLDAMVLELQTADGPGFSRNDDSWDANDLSPWGSNYDSDEWVVIDLRAAVAARELGDLLLADELLAWITDQSAANYNAIGETFDPVTADYTNNAPMVGFGPGAYIAALNHREGVLNVDPACGVYPEEPLPGGDDDDDDTTANDDDTANNDDTVNDDDTVRDGDPVPPVGGCSCGVQRSYSPGDAWMLSLVLLARVRRRR